MHLGKGAVSLADSSELYELRADVAFKLFDQYVMRRDLVKFVESQLGPYPAVRMDGYWESSVEPAGGSFVSFFVADRVKSRIWLIDCLVYAPGQGQERAPARGDRDRRDLQPLAGIHGRRILLTVQPRFDSLTRE